jgi:hypothetical protein
MSRTGDALEALFAVLAAKAGEPSPKIPAPLQNEDLPARLVSIGGDLAMLLNVWDDAQDDDPLELLGADVIADSYEIVKDVPVELVVAGGTRLARRVAFEAALEAIDDAIAADRTLGSVVDDARVLAPRRNGSGLVVDGMPNVLAADIRIRFTFNSSRTF